MTLFLQAADFSDRDIPRGYGGTNTGRQRGCHAGSCNTPTSQKLPTEDKGT